jgi:hypothetical protein
MICECNVCIECFITGYGHAINSAEASLTLNAFSCINCKEPEYGSDKFNDHIEHLTRLVFKISLKNYSKSCFFYFIKIHTHLPKDEKNKFEQKVNEVMIMSNKEFVWCAHGCGGGFLVDFNRIELKCSCVHCGQFMCYKCKEKVNLILNCSNIKIIIIEELFFKVGR